MKTKLFLFVLGLCAYLTVYGQTTVTYEMLKCNREEAKVLKTLLPTAYKASDGFIYSERDTIILGRPSSSHTTAIASKNVATATTSANYSTMVSDASLALSALGGTPTYMSNRQGEYFIITNIKIAPPRKNSTEGAKINLKGNVRGVGTVNIFDFELAIALGEVQSKGMTREKAINILKNAKEQLELDIISQEEYDKLKSELMSYIRQ